MKICTCWGISFQVNGLFLLLFLMFSLLGLFPQVLLVFFMVLIHEGAHLLAAYCGKVELKEIQLLPFGGVAQLGEELALTPGKEIGVALAGPLTSILLGGICYALHPDPSSLLLFLARTNMTLGLFNLTPALPLDGGRIFRSLLTLILGLYQGTVTVLYLSRMMAFILGGISLWGVLAQEGSLFLLIIAFFVYYNAGEERANLSTLMLRYLLKKREDFQEKPYSLLTVLVVQEDLTLKEVVQRLYPHRLHLLYVVDGDLSYQGMFLEMVMIEYLLEGNDFQTRVGSLIL